jgi:hypothetical protein
MDKSKVVLVKIIKPHCYAAEVLQPRKQPLNLPPTLVSPERSSILCRGFHAIRLVRRDHLDALLAKFLIKRITVICPVAYESLRLLVGKNFSDSFCDKSDLMRRSRRRVYGERKTIAVCHRHELRTFAPLGLSHSDAPFLATTNVPSMKHSDRSRSPRCFRSAARASSTLRSVPSRTHCWNLRWQVWYGGNLSGRSCHLAPLRRIQRMPLRTSRVSFQGLPRPSSRRGGVGIRGSMMDHCSSVNSSRLAIDADFSRTRTRYL